MLLVHVHFFGFAVVAVEVNEGIVDIFFLQIVVERSELFGRRQQFCRYLGICFLGLIQLFLKVELLAIDLQDLRGSHPINVKLVMIIGALHCPVYLLQSGNLTIFELQNYPFFDAQLLFLFFSVLLIYLKPCVNFINNQHLNHPINICLFNAQEQAKLNLVIVTE